MKTGNSSFNAPGNGRRQRLARRLAAWSAGWLFAGALYLLLIDTTDLPELIVAVGAAAIAATGFELAREQQTVGGLRARLAVAGADSPAAAQGRRRTSRSSRCSPSGSWCARAAVNGVFRSVPFRCGDGDDALETGRRALAESLGSFAPNTIIVGVDAERELLLGHQLRQSGGDEAIDVLGLGAG